VTGTLAVWSPSPPRKQQIVVAAVELMHDAGFAGTSVRDIGAAVGLLSGSLYHYFREIFALLNSIIWWRHPGSRPAIDRLACDYERILLDGLSYRQAG
jgi:hypothetical protein